MTERDFRDLIAWQKAKELAADTYRITRMFPKEEQFGLINQMRRAAISVPSNIAEGNARGTTRDYVRFLMNARGSLAELETQMIIATELGFMSQTNQLHALLGDVKRILQRLIQSLRDRS